MFTKTFKLDEMIPFGQLRKINQKDLSELVKTNDKVGIMVNSKIKVVMIDIEKYQKMVDLIEEYEQILGENSLL